MGLIQVNVPDTNFRYYFDTETRVRMVSVTRCLSVLAMGESFYQWLRKHGEESKVLTEMAQDSGTKIHGIIETWIKGECIPEDLHLWYMNSVDSVQLSSDEISKLQGFINFNNKYKPKYLHTEITLAIPEIKVAGTIDIICEIDGVIYIVDIKTGSGIHNNNKLQIAFYEKAYRENFVMDYEKRTDRALLHLKSDTKKGYNFQVQKNTLEHDFKGFVAARDLWFWDNPARARFLSESEPKIEEVINAQ